MKKDKKEMPDFIEEHEDGTRTFNMTGTVTWPFKRDKPEFSDLTMKQLLLFPELFNEENEDIDIMPLLLDGSSGNWALEVEFSGVLKEAFKLFKRKHKDYGPTNLSRFGIVGIVVRLSDKLARLENIMKSGGESSVEDETLRDTFLDILNYAAAAVVMLEEKWPNG